MTRDMVDWLRAEDEKIQRQVEYLELMHRRIRKATYVSVVVIILAIALVVWA